MNESEPGNHSSSAARVHSAFFLPSRYKECECVGAQHKSSPHLHLLRTRDPYLNNDNRPMPCSFTAGINEHSSDLDSACCTVIESLYANEAGGAGGWTSRSKEAIRHLHMWSDPSKCILLHAFTTALKCVFSVINLLY